MPRAGSSELPRNRCFPTCRSGNPAATEATAERAENTSGGRAGRSESHKQDKLGQTEA